MFCEAAILLPAQGVLNMATLPRFRLSLSVCVLHQQGVMSGGVRGTLAPALSGVMQAPVDTQLWVKVT